MFKIITLIFTLCINVYGANIGFINGSDLADIGEHGILQGKEVNIIRNGITDNTIQFKQYTSVASLLKDVEEGKIDGGIGGISITPDRVEKYNFSMPTAVSDISVCYNKSDVSATTKLTKPIVIMGFKLFASLFIILTIFAHIIWITERKSGDENHFPTKYFDGIGQSYWWSLVTSSTVGYGDIVPKTATGRLVAGLIIICGISWFGVYVGTVGATVEEVINNTNLTVGIDFDKPITKTGSTTDTILTELNIKHITYNNLDECFKALNEGWGDCIIFDKNKLSKYVNKDDKLAFTSQTFKTEYVGIVLKTNSPYENNINKIIVSQFGKE